LEEAQIIAEEPTCTPDLLPSLLRHLSFPLRCSEQGVMDSCVLGHWGAAKLLPFLLFGGSEQ